MGGDLSEPDTLEGGALAGSDAVFLIWPFLTTEGAPAVLEAIGRHARRIVYLSSSGVNEDAERQTDPINQLHADMERLIEESDVEWTVLRSNTIASNARGVGSADPHHARRSRSRHCRHGSDPRARYRGCGGAHADR
ncbi:hypothetical protein SGLAM104S_04157 [Streptomyces glaucescens]